MADGYTEVMEHDARAQTPSRTSGRIAGDGLLLSYVEWAPSTQSNAPPILLLHGLTSRAGHWESIAGRLALQRRVIALDARGHGDSDWSSEAAYAVDAHFADVVSALDALAIERCVLVGYSMGGSVAILTAGALPERVERLVVVDSYPAPEMTSGSRRIAEWVARAYVSPIKGEAIGASIPSPLTVEESPGRREGQGQGARRLSQEGHTNPSPSGRGQGEGDVSPFQRPGPRRFDPAIARKMAEELAKGEPRRADLWPLWEAISCPVLLVRGALSNVLPADLAAEMLARQPLARLVTFPGVAHPIPYARPAELAALIERFVGERR